MKLLDRFAFGPVAAVRPWLLLKATLLLLALDVWHTHLGPAWRYGAAGFNVAHFAWMNGLPMPTREAYVAMLVGVGVASIVCALMARPPRALLVLIAFLYTWGWACSMHDSYQHHYLISLILAGFCFFPQLDSAQMFGTIGKPKETDDATARSVKKGAKVATKTAKVEGPSPVLTALPHGPVPRVYSVGYAMVTVVAAVVYAFTAISKSEIEWRDGDALRNITHGGTSIPDVVSLAHAFGMTDETLFWLMGHSVIAVQIVCSLGYLLATSRDGESTVGERTRLRDQLAALHADRVRITIALTVIPTLSAIAVIAPGLFIPGWVVLIVALGASAAALPAAFHRFLFAPLGRPSARAIFASIALLNALSFHVGAEYIGLQIGWFSYYMMILAVIALAPAHWLSALAMALSAPFRGTRTPLLSRWPIAGPVLGVGAAIVAVLAGSGVDIPGAYECSMLIGMASFAFGISAMMRPELGADRTRGVVAVAIAMLVLYVSVSTGSERYDYYRFAGGDFRRRHQYVDALEAYREADLYAPEGESRATQIHQMEQMIESGAP
jgi:hypothetical protein